MVGVHEELSGGSLPGTQRPSCAFCGYAVPASVTPLQEDGQPFCSRPCAERYVAGEAPFSGALGFKRRPVGVAAMEASLPAGVPGDAAVLVAGEEGTRLEGVLLELVWRTLERGEPVVVVSVDNPPSALVDSFLAHGWNVLPHLAAGSLAVVDLFTSRLADEAFDVTPENRWAGYLRSTLEGSTTVVRDPSDVREVANQLDNALEELRMTTTGVVAVDYLTELATFAQEVRASSLLKELRAQVCKRRHVPLFAGGSRPIREGLYPTAFPHDHEYLFDGIVDLRVNDDLGDGARVPQLSVRKMDDVPADPDWLAYEFHPGRGFVPLDLFDGDDSVDYR